MGLHRQTCRETPLLILFPLLVLVGFKEKQTHDAPVTKIKTKDWVFFPRNQATFEVLNFPFGQSCFACRCSMNNIENKVNGMIRLDPDPAALTPGQIGHMRHPCTPPQTRKRCATVPSRQHRRLTHTHTQCPSAAHAPLSSHQRFS